MLSITIRQFFKFVSKCPPEEFFVERSSNLPNTLLWSAPLVLHTRGLLNFGPSGGGEEGGAYFKFFDRQRQNVSMEFEMLRSFNNNNKVNYCVI